MAGCGARNPPCGPDALDGFHFKLDISISGFDSDKTGTGRVGSLKFAEERREMLRHPEATAGLNRSRACPPGLPNRGKTASFERTEGF